MGFNNFPNNFTATSQQLVNPQNGQPTTNFWRALLAIFNRTGGSNGTSYQVATGLAATGANAAAALALGADWNQITTVPASSGVLLPSMQPGSDISVWNDSGTNLTVYPPSGSMINGAASQTVNAGSLAYFQCWSATAILMPYNVAV